MCFSPMCLKTGLVLLDLSMTKGTYQHDGFNIPSSVVLERKPRERRGGYNIPSSVGSNMRSQFFFFSENSSSLCLSNRMCTPFLSSIRASHKHCLCVRRDTGAWGTTSIPWGRRWGGKRIHHPGSCLGVGEGAGWVTALHASMPSSHGGWEQHAGPDMKEAHTHFVQ